MGGPPVPEQVLSAARRHLEGAPPLPGCRWVVTPGERVPGGWFFTYRVERNLDRVWEEIGRRHGPDAAAALARDAGEVVNRKRAGAGGGK